MSNPQALAGRHIVLGLSGGIACYKSAELVRELGRAGATVQVVMTDAAQAFITPVTMQALSNRPVFTSQWDARDHNDMAHINLTREADAIPIAPASAAQGELAQFNPWLDPVHRIAMEAARDEGQPRLTTRVAWPGINADIHVVVWYMPVYQRDAAVDSPDARASALIGYVGIPIQVPGVVDVLAQQVPNAQLTLECHSGASEMFDLPAADADALVKIANKLGLSRAELLRHMARELIENYTHNGENR